MRILRYRSLLALIFSGLSQATPDNEGVETGLNAQADLPKNANYNGIGIDWSKTFSLGDNSIPPDVNLLQVGGKDGQKVPGFKLTWLECGLSGEITQRILARFDRAPELDAMVQDTRKNVTSNESQTAAAPAVTTRNGKPIEARSESGIFNHCPEDFPENPTCRQCLKIRALTGLHISSRCERICHEAHFKVNRHGECEMQGLEHQSSSSTAKRDDILNDAEAASLTLSPDEPSPITSISGSQKSIEARAESGIFDRCPDDFPDDATCMKCFGIHLVTGLYINNRCESICNTHVKFDWHGGCKVEGVEQSSAFRSLLSMHQTQTPSTARSHTRPSPVKPTSEVTKATSTNPKLTSKDSEPTTTDMEQSSQRTELSSKDAEHTSNGNRRLTASDKPSFPSPSAKSHPASEPLPKSHDGLVKLPITLHIERLGEDIEISHGLDHFKSMSSSMWDLLSLWRLGEETQLMEAIATKGIQLAIIELTGELPLPPETIPPPPPGTEMRLGVVPLVPIAAGLPIAISPPATPPAPSPPEEDDPCPPELSLPQILSIPLDDVADKSSISSGSLLARHAMDQNPQADPPDGGRMWLWMQISAQEDFAIGLSIDWWGSNRYTIAPSIAWKSDSSSPIEIKPQIFEKDHSGGLKGPMPWANYADAHSKKLKFKVFDVNIDFAPINIKFAIGSKFKLKGKLPGVNATIPAGSKYVVDILAGKVVENSMKPKAMHLPMSLDGSDPSLYTQVAIGPLVKVKPYPNFPNTKLPKMKTPCKPKWMKELEKFIRTAKVFKSVIGHVWKNRKDIYKIFKPQQGQNTIFGATSNGLGSGDQPVMSGGNGDVPASTNPLAKREDKKEPSTIEKLKKYGFGDPWAVGAKLDLLRFDYILAAGKEVQKDCNNTTDAIKQQVIFRTGLTPYMSFFAWKIDTSWLPKIDKSSVTQTGLYKSWKLWESCSPKSSFKNSTQPKIQEAIKKQLNGTKSLGTDLDEGYTASSGNDELDALTLNDYAKQNEASVDETAAHFQKQLNEMK